MLSKEELRQAISLGTDMAESEAKAMLAMKAWHVADRDRRRPRLVVDNTRSGIRARPIEELIEAFEWLEDHCWVLPPSERASPRPSPTTPPARNDSP